MKPLKKYYTPKIRLKIKSQYTNKYYELLCDIFYKKYGLTRKDFLNGNGGIGFINSKAKSIICFILRSERGYSLNRTANILNTSHSIIYSHIRQHEDRINRNEFGYKEMFLEVLANFLYEAGKIEKDLTCNPCVALGFERVKRKKK